MYACDLAANVKKHVVINSESREHAAYREKVDNQIISQSVKLPPKLH